MVLIFCLPVHIVSVETNLHKKISSLPARTALNYLVERSCPLIPLTIERNHFLT